MNLHTTSNLAEADKQNNSSSSPYWRIRVINAIRPLYDVETGEIIKDYVDLTQSSDSESESDEERQFWISALENPTIQQNEFNDHEHDAQIQNTSTSDYEEQTSSQDFESNFAENVSQFMEIRGLETPIMPERQYKRETKLLNAKVQSIRKVMPRKIKKRHTQQFVRMQKKYKTSLVVRSSKIHGHGLFTTKAFYKSQMVVEYSGKVLSDPEAEVSGKFNKRRLDKDFLFAVDDGVYVDGSIYGNRAKYVNHSCQPNCVAKVLNIDGRFRVILFAKKNIPENTELTIDYMFEIQTPSEVKCYCQAKRCRGFIDG